MTSTNFLYSCFIFTPHVNSIQHISNNIILIQHQIININNSFHLQFSDNIEFIFTRELPYIVIIRNAELEHFFYSIDLNERSPPLYEIGRNIL